MTNEARNDLIAYLANLTSEEFLALSRMMLEEGRNARNKEQLQQAALAGGIHVRTPFQERYWRRLDLFMQECVDWSGTRGPTNYQMDVAASLGEKERVAVAGPHGLGKTTTAALAILWFALTRDSDNISNDWKIITTASGFRQLTHYLWPEVHKWCGRICWDKVGRSPFTETELLQREIKLRSGRAIAVASNRHELIEGAHARFMLFVYDEAKAIPTSTFNAIEGAFANAGNAQGDEAWAVAISTPGECHGRFYEIVNRHPGLENWHVRTVSKEECIAAGRMSKTWAENCLRLWRESSALYQNRVLGRFAAQDSNSIVPLAWIQDAIERHKLWEADGFPGEFIIESADIAEGGSNQTVRCRFYKIDRARYGGQYAVREFLHDDHQAEKELATMATARRMSEQAKLHPGLRLIVDAVGVGAGIGHRLVELNHPTVRFKGGEKTERMDALKIHTFKDCNAAAWYTMREMFDPELNFNILVPHHELLMRDLATRRYDIRTDGLIKVESKSEMEKRLKNREDDDEAPQNKYESPDTGDALAMACFLAVIPKPGGSGAIAAAGRNDRRILGQKPPSHFIKKKTFY